MKKVDSELATQYEYINALNHVRLSLMIIVYSFR